MVAEPGPRMGTIILVTKLVAGEAGVDLGRRDARVAKELLDVAQGRSTPEEVGGEAVPEGMGSDVRVNPRLPSKVLEDQPEALPREPVTPSIEEEGLLIPTPAQRKPGPSPRSGRTIPGLSTPCGTVSC